MNKTIASIALLIALTMPLLAPAGPPKALKADAPAASAPLVGDAASGEAKIVLSAHQSARIGELVRLDVSESKATSYKWLLVPSTPDFLVYDGGARAVFSARKAGEYQFIVACGAADGSVDVVTHVVRVQAPPSEPTGDSFAAWIPYWNWTLDLPKDECIAVADNFDDLADRSATLNTPQQWIDATAQANRDALGDRIGAWAPMLDKIGEKLLKRAEAGALQTPEDHAKVWREIADGLRACQ